MNNLIKEVGIKRILRYLIMEIWYAVFLLLPYSPLRIFWLKLGGAKSAATVLLIVSF